MKIRVAQCWDDGRATDERLIAVLKKYHAKATFNLCPGLMPEETLPPRWIPDGAPEWSHNGFDGGHIGTSRLREVYDGFQVASHCWEHQCAGLLPDDAFLDAAMRARSFLENVFQRECRGFAWPCGRFTPETADLLRKAGFAYGRTCVNSDAVVPCRDPMLLSSSCHFMNPNFLKRFKAAKTTSHVFYFWGHSYEMYEYDMLWKRMEERIAFLSADPDVEWVDVVDLVR